MDTKQIDLDAAYSLLEVLQDNMNYGGDGESEGVALIGSAPEWCRELVKDICFDGKHSDLKTMELFGKIVDTFVRVIGRKEEKQGNVEAIKQEILDSYGENTLNSDEVKAWALGVPHALHWALKSEVDVRASEQENEWRAYFKHVEFIVVTLFKHIVKQMEEEMDKKVVDKEVVK